MADSLQQATRDFRVSAPQVLLVEDSDIAAKLIGDQLHEGWPDARVERVGSLAEALAMLTAEHWDVVLTDLGLPDSYGLDTLQKLRDQSSTVPIVVLTANNDTELALEALEEHAQDFLVKRRMDPEVLARTIRYAIGRQRIVARLQAAAAEATRSENNLHQLISRSSDGIVVCDELGRVLYANEAALPLMPSVVDGLLGEPVRELPLEREHAELSVSSARGSLVIDARVVGVDWEGKPAKMVLLRDITQQRSNEELRLQLERAERLAAIGQLAASVAHEINNPLAYVIANLELITRDLRRETEGDSAHRDRYVRRIDHALEGAQRVARIVADLGTFSRKEPPELARPTDLNEAVVSALTMASTQLKHRAVVRSTFAELPPVHGDSGRLCQVFLNLLVNAAQAMREGHAQENTLDVRTFVDGDVAVAEIRDSGVGLPSEVKARAFEPFFTTKSAGEGSGLGLYVCKNILSSFGGTIELAASDPRGTLARVRVPLWRKAIPKEQATNGARPCAGTRARVLVVDDEPFLLRSLSDLLSDSHDVVTCASGKEAEALLQTDERFDAILCDVVMPNGTGPELLAWLKARGSPLSDRLAFMTGGGVAALHALPSDGSIPILAKPFSLDELLAHIAALAPSAGR